MVRPGIADVTGSIAIAKDCGAIVSRWEPKSLDFGFLNSDVFFPCPEI